MRIRLVWKASFVSTSVELPRNRQPHLIVVHVRVARICCDEPSSAGDLAAVRKNRHVARVLPERDRVRQPKRLTQTRQQKESIRPRGALLFGIRSKVRPRRMSTSILIQLSVS